MITFSNIKIFVSSNSEAEDVIEIIKSACDKSSEYYFETQKSVEYQGICNVPAFHIAKYFKGCCYAALFFKTQKSKKGKLFIENVNIIPRTKAIIEANEYQKILFDFFHFIKPQLKKQDIKSSFIKPQKLELENLITGKYTRSLFLRYIAIQQIGFGKFSTDPRDTEYLDFFILALDRYKCQVDIQILYTYMINKIGWKPHDAKWVKQRIQTGLEILECKRNF